MPSWLSHATFLKGPHAVEGWAVPRVTKTATEQTKKESRRKPLKKEDARAAEKGTFDGLQTWN